MKKELKHVIINYPTSFQLLIDEFDSFDTYNKILIFFGLTDFYKININLFNDKEEFFSYLKREMGENTYFPPYCISTFNSKNINLYIEKFDNNNLYDIYCKIMHEFVHIVFGTIYDKRVRWFDEGLAQNLSGEKDKLIDKKMIAFLDRINQNSLPSFAQIDGKDAFIKYDKNYRMIYSGYAISYVVVKYILQTLNKEEIDIMLRNHKEILDFQNDHLIIDAIKYCYNIYASDKSPIQQNLK